MGMSKLNSIAETIEQLKAGKMIIVVDDEKRENEGDLMIAAEKITPEAINFMTKYARGLLCLVINQELAQRSNLYPMTMNNTSKYSCNFTISVDAKENTTTGISAFDRAQTIRTILNPKTKPEDLARPGHVFPLVADARGVLKRAGHTEAALDLVKLSGLYPAMVLCAILDEDGKMAKLPKLLEVAQKFNLKVVSVQDLIAYRRKTEKLVEKMTSVRFPTKFGDFKLHLYKYLIEEEYHLAIVKGEVKGKENILVRMHSQCLTGDLFGSKRCDCGDQLAFSLDMIEKEAQGVFLYLMQEGRGIGLANKIMAYELQDKGKETEEANLELGFEPDMRDYSLGAQILKDLGVSSMRLVTNNPNKIKGLEEYGLKVIERIPALVNPTDENRKYLATKKEKLGNLIELLHK